MHDVGVKNMGFRPQLTQSRWIRRDVKCYAGCGTGRRIPVTDVHLVLVDSAARLMPRLPHRYGETALRVLHRKAVDARLAALRRQVEPHGLWLGETCLATETVIWTGGIRAPQLLGDSGLPTDSEGRLRVDRNLRTERCPEIYAIGDAARFETETMKPLAATAAVAIQNR